MGPQHAEGLSAALAAQALHIAQQPLSPTTLQAARRALLDGLGVMWAASRLAPECTPFLDLAEGTPGPSLVLGTQFHSTPALAALANGALAHALDYEDALDGAPLHPDAALIPAVLALAATRPTLTQGQLLAAITAGCDIACRMAMALRQPLENGGWYPPPILGAFGAVAGAAAVLGLSPRQLTDAWSLLLLQNSCPGEIKYSADTVIRAVREAFPAQAAVQCVQLAAAGVRGFDAPLEGRNGFFALFAGGQFDAATLQDGPGQVAWIERLSFKPWPCCRGTHPHVALALQLRGQHALHWQDIVRIDLSGGATQRMLAEPVARKQAPATAIDAKFSLPFTVATALVHGAVKLDSFDAPARADAQVLQLAARTSYRCTAPQLPDNPTGGALALQLRDGRVLEASTDHAPGSPQQPLAEAELVGKFIDCMARGRRALPPEHAAAMADLVLALPASAPASTLLQALAAP
jgi:2-methylcitrate dehydratase PrpD